jgi:hypothetical protein
MENLIADDELYSYFRNAMPDATNKEIALSMADFLEQVPPKEPLSDEEKINMQKWIKELREYASVKDKIETLIHNCTK